MLTKIFRKNDIFLREIINLNLKSFFFGVVDFFMKKLPKSIRKYIRKEKARIRREILDLKEQERKIKELYEKIFYKLKIQNNNLKYES